jgi:hypothetical protein
MVVINMPGGAVQDIEETEILWFRKAFDSEWAGATMLRLTSDRIYSIESVADLSEKFEQAGVPLAGFAAPDVKLKLVVSTKRVRRVLDGDPEIYHDKAKSILVFSPRLRLAVRENADEAREKLKDAKVS